MKHYYQNNKGKLLVYPIDEGIFNYLRKNPQDYLIQNRKTDTTWRSVCFYQYGRSITQVRFYRMSISYTEPAVKEALAKLLHFATYERDLDTR